jgi:two-component system cell cycle sensor histidine kinase/response regulator CckA
MDTSASGLWSIQIAQALGQLVLALVLSVILSAFQRAYRQAYVRHWALSWLALAVYMLGSIALRGSVGAPALGRGALYAVTFVAAYLQVAWLLLGARGLARGEEPGRRTAGWAVGAALVAGLASVWPALAGVTAPSAGGLRCLVAGVAYLFAAVVLLEQGRPAARIGRNFARLALGAYAVDQFAYFGLSFVRREAFEPLRMQLSAFDVVATAVIGLALVAWLLEDERERLLRAGEDGLRRGRAQACVYRISEATRTVFDLPELFRSIHESLAEVLPARNFYIALFDPASGLLSFPYFADERDPTPAPKPLGRGLTEYVLRHREPLLATPAVFDELRARGEVEPIASDCVDWLGAPLVTRGEAIGVAAIQTYDPRVRLSPEERDLFMFVAEQIAAAIEAKRAEEALRHSEARLRLSMEQLPAVLWTTDRELRFESSAGAGLAALGLKPNQLVGLPVESYLGTGSQSVSWHRRALAGESASFDHEQDGRAFTVHVEPLRDAAGAVRGTIGIAVDLTEQRRVDRALRESEARLRQVVNLVPHFIFAKDEEGRFLLVNRAGAEAYGTTVEGLIGRTDGDFAASAEEVRQFREADLEVMRSGNPKLIPEERITDASGRQRWLQTTKIPFTFSGTGRPAVLGVSIDIGERKGAEEALRRAAKEESLSVLAGGVAHDFNNLLAVILGHAALALKQLHEGSAARAHVEKVAFAVERASDLTRQMLAYSGRGHFVVQPTDLNLLVRENVPLLEVALPKSVRLESRLASGLPHVDADVGQLQQVLMNLVINAAEAIGDRGGTVAITTGVREVAWGDAELWRASGQPLSPGRYVALEVCDDGPGMAPETLDRIFEPFFTTKFTGRGLGLAAVLGVVRGHHGALSVDSAPGKGTVFRLLFAPGTQLAAGEPTPGAGQVPHRLTVLLVDDEAIVREMVSEVLKAEGLDVLCAEDGAKAVALYGERCREIDVVLLDLSMPGLGGEQTYVRLRAIEPTVRVILSSGYDQDEATRRFGAEGPVGFIQKPYRPSRLMAEIERCLGPAFVPGRRPGAPPR